MINMATMGIIAAPQAMAIIFLLREKRIRYIPAATKQSNGDTFYYLFQDYMNCIIAGKRCSDTYHFLVFILYD